MTGDGDRADYAAVQHAREDLAEVTAGTSVTAAALGLDLRREELDALGARIRGDTYRILMLGQGNRGKSTLLNALLGAKVLPAMPRATTAVPISVVWDSDRYVVLHLEGSEPPVALPIEETGISRNGEVWRALTIDPKNRHQPGAVRHAELHWPAELCRNGVVLVDSPGLNQEPWLHQATLNALMDADVVVFVIASDLDLEPVEIGYAKDYLRPYGHEDFFVACTRIDHIAAEERDGHIEYLTEYAQNSLLVAAERVFFLDSRSALDLRSTCPSSASAWSDELAATGLPALAAALEGHLVAKRATVKVLAPARRLALAISALRTEVEARQSLRKQRYDQARARCATVRAELGPLEERRDQIRDRIDTSLEHIGLQVNAAARRFLLAAAEECPGWLDGIKPKNKIGPSPFKAKQQAKAVAAEYVAGLSTAFEARFVQWQTEELNPQITRRLEELGARLDEDFLAFTAQADKIRLVLTPMADVAPDVDAASRPTAERLLAAAVATLVAGAGAAPIGARFGFKDAMKALVPQFALGIAAYAVGGPVGVFVVQLLASAVAVEWLAAKADSGIARSVASAMAEHLRASADTEAARLASTVTDGLGSLKPIACQALDAEIEAILRQLAVAEAEEADKAGAVDDRALADHARMLDDHALRVEEILRNWQVR
ncbi:Bacterial dynamin-like protein [Streptomyces sp. enrichment culture]|uniref:dynamin family protein n=1 Tax=Streptomyces sp. enrichment culture TaxID=1795815 RepID=UPI003F55976B